MKKMFLFLVVFFSWVFLWNNPVVALGIDEVMLREMNAKAVAEQVDYNDGSLINITYVGSSTEAAIAVNATYLYSYTPIGTLDSNFGTSGTYDLTAAAYNTLGEVCDAIDDLADYTCKLTGGKRDDSSGLLKNITSSASTDAKASGGYSVLIDTGGAVATDPYIMRIGITPSSGKRVVLKHCTVQSDGVGTIKVYGKLAKYDGDSSITRNDTTLVWSEPIADDTAESIPNSSVIGGDRWLEFGKDEHVVISAGNSSTAQTSTSYLRCAWDEK